MTSTLSLAVSEPLRDARARRQRHAERVGRGGRMHGRKKPTREETAEERSERLKKYAKYKKLSDTALALVRPLARACVLGFRSRACACGSVPSAA